MIAEPIQTFLDRLSEIRRDTWTANPTDHLVQVHSITSRTGVFYEKLRYLVDDVEEHLIRRSAIERILKRSLVLENKGNVGMMLLTELVSGGYLPHNAIPEKIAANIQAITNKYLVIRQILRDRNELTQFQKILISCVASEIEAFLYPAPSDDLIVEALYHTVKDRIRRSDALSPEEFNTQVYIAARRSLLKNDNKALIYALWRRVTPNWGNETDVGSIRLVGEQFARTIRGIESRVDDDFNLHLTPKLRNQSIFFSLLKELVDQYGLEAKNIISNTSYFDELVTENLKSKYKKQSERSRRSGWRAVGYVFFTKIILAFVIELPYEVFFLKGIVYPAFITNIVFHPLLLLAITWRIRFDEADNTGFILNGLHEVLYGSISKPISGGRRGGSFVRGLFTVLYGAMFLGIFYAIISLLQSFNFNIVSIVLFLLFLTIVSYFGLRIRFNAKRWKADSGTDGAFVTLWNLLTLPLVSMGQWFIRRVATVNLFVLFLDFIIETPFKLLLSTLDSFISYLKEKSEETYNV